MNGRILKALITKHSAEMAIEAIQRTRNTARAYAEKDRGMGKTKPYDEPDYRTLELLERQFQKSLDDTWYDLHETEEY